MLRKSAFQEIVGSMLFLLRKFTCDFHIMYRENYVQFLFFHKFLPLEIIFENSNKNFFKVLVSMVNALMALREEIIEHSLYASSSKPVTSSSQLLLEHIRQLLP